jgi:hypothetical protein
VLLRIFIFSYSWVCYNTVKSREDREETKALRNKLELRIIRIVNSLKIHEDIICIDISSNNSSKLEAEILTPLIKNVGNMFYSPKLISFFKEMCKDCELTSTLRVVNHLQANARTIIQNQNKKDRAYTRAAIPGAPENIDAGPRGAN